MTTGTIADHDELFNGGPPRRLETALRLIKPDKPKKIRCVLLIALIGWAPLMVLAGVQSLVLGQDKLSDLVFDFAVYTRYLIALPLLVMAEFLTLPKLGSTARHFVTAGLIRDSDRPRFELIAASTRRLLHSKVVEVLVVVLAYAAILIVIRRVPVDIIPDWHVLTKVPISFSWAGWWHALVTMPLSLTVLLGWMWRLFLWGVLLWRVSRLDLHLVPAHPDLSGGLQFVGASLRAFLLISFAFGAAVAGGVANRVVHQGMSLFDFKYAIAALVVSVLVLFVAPLTFFIREILQARRRGIFEYGALAGAVGRQMERTWLEPGGKLNERALEVQHFSATTDLYQMVSNVYNVKGVPLDLQDLIALVVALLLPFLPVLLFEMPLNVILPDLMKLLL